MNYRGEYIVRISVSNNFKQACKGSENPIKYATLHIVEDNIDITDSDYLVDFTITANCYKDKNFIGSTACKKITVNLLSNSNINLEGKTIDVYTGILINNNIENVFLGSFIIEKPKDEELTEKTSFTGYDYLIKFNTPFKNKYSYPISLFNLLSNVCSEVGIELENQTIVNGNYQVLGNPFTSGESNTVVLEQICQLCGGFARISSTNRLKIINLDENEISDTLDGNVYTSLSKNLKYGKINSVTLNLSSIEGERTTLRDEESIRKNGLTDIQISDNYFLINAAEREKAITQIFNILDGIEYTPFEMEYYGFPYLEIGDRIAIVDTNDETFYTYIFDIEFKYDGSYNSKIKLEQNTQMQQVYGQNGTTKQQLRKVERLVDKINGEIVDVIETQGEQNAKISKVTQTVDDINSKISDIADITTSQESVNGVLNFEKINESEPISVKIRPNGENISYLYPFEGLYPSNDLYIRIRTLRFINTKTNEIFDYELPCDLLYYDNENYDEFIMEYGTDNINHSCYVTKKCTYDNNGNVILLKTPQTIEFEYPQILLTTGDYQVKILKYDNTPYLAYIFARLMTENIYTTQFYTKAEVTSIIDQKVDEIDIGVNKKLSNYSTTNEMNSAINVKANQITSSVSETYATKNQLNNCPTKTEMNSAISQTAENISTEVNKKVNNSDFGTKIQQNAEAVKYAWNQISQYIQLEIINNKVCLAIRDKNNKLLMVIDQEGQHFYDQNKKIVETIAMPSSSLPTLFFNVDGDTVVNNQGIYNTALGFSVAMTSSSDNKKYYYPMFYWGRLNTNQNQGVHVKEKLIFDDGNESASQSPYIDKNSGGLVFLVKDGSDIMVKTLNNKTVATIGQGKFKINDSSQKVVIELFKNSSGTYTLNMPTVAIKAESLYLGNTSYFEAGYITANSWVSTQHVEADNVPDICDCSTISTGSNSLHITSKDGSKDWFFKPDSTSDARLKKNIETSDKDALELINSIQHYSFNWKDNNKYEDIGYIAQELEKIDKNLVNKYEIVDDKNNVIDYHWTINDKYIIVNLTRAVQQQQELIDYVYSQLKIKKVKNKKIKKEKYEKDFGEKAKINFKYEKEKLRIQEIKEKLKGGKQGTK